MQFAAERFQRLSISTKVAIGAAVGVSLATLSFALLLIYVTQQSLQATKEARLVQAQGVASYLDSISHQYPQFTISPLELPSLSLSANVLALTVIDNDGNIMMASGTTPRTGIEPHMTILGDLVRERRAEVRIHRMGESSHLVAFSPMESVSGGVVVDFLPDKLLDIPDRLPRISLLFGLVVMMVASAGAWLHARYVIRPLRGLEKAAARIASGMVDQPVLTTKRQDEIGRLARSFEAMRSQIKTASEAREWWERELEQRVRERTAEVQRLVERAIRAQEEERQRLAQELHDDTAQALATLLIGVEALRDALPEGQTRVRQHIERTTAQGSRALEDLRRVILGLRPAAVDDLGVVAALRSYAGARLGPMGVHLDFAVQGTEQRWPHGVETGLFRILQEAISNAARHARAQNVRVRFDFQGHQLVALVEDDGQGFDPSQVRAAGGGLGLEGMRERAETIGARLEVTSAPGKGTRVRVELPIGEAPDA